MRDLNGSDDPHLVRIDAVVMMSQDDTQAGDLQQPLHRQLPQPVLVPGFPAVLDHVSDQVSGIEDVQYPLAVGPAHRSTDSSRISRSRSLSPPADTTSTE